MDLSRLRYSRRGARAELPGHQVEHGCKGFYHNSFGELKNPFPFMNRPMLTGILKARSLRDADSIHIVPAKHRGQGEIVPIIKKNVSRSRSCHRGSCH